jgi:hypothetical protein
VQSLSTGVYCPATVIFEGHRAKVRFNQGRQIVLELDNPVTTESEEIVGVDQDHNFWAVYVDNEATEAGPSAELSFERPKEGWVISAAGGRSGPASPLSLTRYFAERSSPSRVRCAAQNQRALDRSGPFDEHCSVMRERGLTNVGLSGASRWSASESFRVGEFSTGELGKFQPALTR